MTATEAGPEDDQRPALPAQPLATINLNSTLLGALAGRGNATSRLAAEAMVAVGLELEDRGHVLNRGWCTSAYLALHAPIDQSIRLAPPKARRKAAS